MTMKVIKIKDGIPNGTVIPMSALMGADGAVGKWVEQQLIRKYFPLVDGSGPDMPSLGIEIKTRTVGTNAMLTVGTMTVNDISTKDWEYTHLYNKLQNMYIVYYDRDTAVVTKNYMVDLGGSDLQEKFKKAYEKGARIVSAQEEIGIHNTVTCGQYGHFEPKYVGQIFNGSYAFRIPVKGWRMVENEALSRKFYENLFEEEGV